MDWLQRELAECMTLASKVREQSQEAKKDMAEEMIAEIEKASDIVDRYDDDPEFLIQMLLDIQLEFGWLPKSSLRWLSQKLSIPLPRIYQIGSFYKAFSLVPAGRHTIRVCTGTACHVRGASRLVSRVADTLGIAPDGTTADLRLSFKTVNCLGCCALGPVMKVDEDYYTEPSGSELKQILESYE